MDWHALFEASSQKLRSEFEQARITVEHRGTKGHVNEAIVTEFLKGVLPARVGFCTGEAIDMDGGRSRQVDVLAYDHQSAPMVFSQGDVRVLPIESVYAAIEVKARLNKQETENAFENMGAIKALQRRAYFPNLHLPRSRQYDMPGSNWRTTFFIFALDGDAMETIAGHMQRLNEQQPLDQRIDMVLVLNKGLITNQSPDGLTALPAAATKLFVKESKNALLAFYAQLHTLLAQTYSEPVDMNQYIKRLSL